MSLKLKKDMKRFSYKKNSANVFFEAIVVSEKGWVFLKVDFAGGIYSSRLLSNLYFQAVISFCVYINGGYFFMKNLTGHSYFPRLFRLCGPFMFGIRYGRLDYKYNILIPFWLFCNRLFDLYLI